MAFEQSQFDALKQEVVKLRAELDQIKQYTSSVRETEQLRYLTGGLKGTNTFYVATSSGGAVTNEITVKNGIITNG